MANKNSSKTPKVRRNPIILLVAGLMFVTGAYLLLLTLSPEIGFISSPYQLSDNEVAKAKEELKNENYVLIDKINLMVSFYTGDSSDILNKGAWHRFPERGDPEKGGNFILSAHRFQLGLTPAGTKQKSPFYSLNKVAVGDEIDIHFNGQDYKYRVTRTYLVSPDAVEIEAPSDEAKLTLYTCTLKGSADGRAVVEAELLVQ